MIRVREYLEEADASGVVEGGGGMGSEEGGEAPSIGEGGGGGAVGEDDEVPQVRRLRDEGRHEAAAGEEEQLRRRLIEQVVQTLPTQPRLASGEPKQSITRGINQNQGRSLSRTSSAVCDRGAVPR